MRDGSNKQRSFQVLVVDDDSLIRYIIPKALKNMDVAVDVAENGLEAQKKIIAGQYDLVITDFNMPEMNGLDLLLWMKENRPLIEGVVMTGYDISDALTDELADFIKDYLAKPFPMATLQEIVKKSMRRLHYFDKAREGKEG